MGKYLLRKTATLLVVLLVVSFVTFFIIHLTPGDPAHVMLGSEATAEQVEALRERMGLNRPLPVQYVEWLGDVLRGNLGESIFMEGTMLEIIAENGSDYCRIDLESIENLIFKRVYSDDEKAAYVIYGNEGGLLTKIEFIIARKVEYLEDLLCTEQIAIGKQ